MGNEGSLPEGHEPDEEFEYQAKAPPSYSNPTNPTTQQRSGRMMNALRRDKSKQNAAGGLTGNETADGYSIGGNSHSTAVDSGVRTPQSSYLDEVWQHQQNHAQHLKTSTIGNGNQQACYPSTLQQSNGSTSGAQDG